MDTSSFRRRSPWLPAAVIVAVTLAVYARSLGNAFVQWDDPLLITKNPIVQSLSLHTLWLAFTSFDPELYIPFTFVSFQINHAIHGLHPFGYHLVNLLLHIGSALLVLRIGRRLTGSLAASFIAALLFAIHPLHTEAVAWASARKDVLAGFFALLSVDLWLQWADRKREGAYRWSVLSYLAALLAKVNVIVLPLVLGCVDHARDERVDRTRVWRYTPFLLLSMLFGVIAALGKSGRNTGLLWEKAVIGAKATMFYLYKLLLPTGLSVLYPYTKPISLTHPDLFVPLLLVIGISAALFALRRRFPMAAAAWCAYLLLLAPSFTNFAKGQDALRDVYFASDRYAYLASIPLLLLAGVVTDRLLRRWRMPTAAALALVVGTFSVLTYRQSLTWRDSETLFRTVTVHYPLSHVAHANLGTFLYQRGKAAAALQEYQTSLAIRPNNLAFYNLGVIALESGLTSRAEEFFRKALEQRPWDAVTMTKLGDVLLKEGRTGEAIAILEQAIAQSGTPPEAQILLEQARGELQTE